MSEIAECLRRALCTSGVGSRCVLCSRPAMNGILAFQHDGRVMVPRIPLTWQIGARGVALDHPLIAGILNVTPDSFSDGGNFTSPAAAIAHARRLITDGADIIDVGGESTRPGAAPVAPEEEARRVIPVVAALRHRWPDILISVDTVKAEIAQAALDVGADIVNDVSAMRLDRLMTRTLAISNCGVILMHSRGTVQDMATYDHATYGEDPVGEMMSELSARVHIAESSGVGRNRIVIDPGLGFAKQSEHSRLALKQLHRFVELGYPVMVGPSRKRFVREAMAAGAARIYGSDGPIDPNEFAISDRDAGTVGAAVAALAQGARLFRVHDVRAHRRALDVAWAILWGGSMPLQTEQADESPEENEPRARDLLAG